MALDALGCNHLAPLGFKELNNQFETNLAVFATKTTDSLRSFEDKPVFFDGGTTLLMYIV